MMKMLNTIPALPVQYIDKAVTFYESKLGFTSRHQDEGFAILNRDSVEVHLWAACDKGWKLRSIGLFIRPIWSGAESFLAGTASCRIEADNIDDLFYEYKNKQYCTRQPQLWKRHIGEHGNFRRWTCIAIY